MNFMNRKLSTFSTTLIYFSCPTTVVSYCVPYNYNTNEENTWTWFIYGSARYSDTKWKDIIFSLPQEFEMALKDGKRKSFRYADI